MSRVGESVGWGGEQILKQKLQIRSTLLTVNRAWEEVRVALLKSCLAPVLKVSPTACSFPLCTPDSQEGRRESGASTSCGAMALSAERRGLLTYRGW